MGGRGVARGVARGAGEKGERKGGREGGSGSRARPRVCETSFRNDGRRTTRFARWHSREEREGRRQEGVQRRALPPKVDVGVKQGDVNRHVAQKGKCLPHPCTRVVDWVVELGEGVEWGLYPLPPLLSPFLRIAWEIDWKRERTTFCVTLRCVHTHEKTYTHTSRT